MPIVSGYTHMLRAVDNGTRVRIGGDNISTTPISVEVGAPTETWPVGTYIEVVRLPDCAASVTLVPAFGVTVNFLTTTSGQPIQTLAIGEYARVNLVSPGVWDMHVYPLPSAGGGGSARLVVYDTEFTDAFDDWAATGFFADDVSVMTFGNGLRIRDQADKGGTAGKYVVISPAKRKKLFTFDNTPPSVVLYSTMGAIGSTTKSTLLVMPAPLTATGQGFRYDYSTPGEITIAGPVQSYLEFTFKMVVPTDSTNTNGLALFRVAGNTFKIFGGKSSTTSLPFLQSGNIATELVIGALDAIVDVRIRMDASGASYYLNGSLTPAAVDTSTDVSTALAYIQNPLNNQAIEQFHAGNDQYTDTGTYFLMSELVITTG